MIEKHLVDRALTNEAMITFNQQVLNWFRIDPKWSRNSAYPKYNNLLPLTATIDGREWCFKFELAFKWVWLWGVCIAQVSLKESISLRIRIIPNAAMDAALL